VLVGSTVVTQEPSLLPSVIAGDRQAQECGDVGVCHSIRMPHALRHTYLRVSHFSENLGYS